MSARTPPHASPLSIESWLIELACQAIRELPPSNVWQHAAAEIFLEGHATLRAGAYDPDLTPYCKLPQEAATGQFTNIPEGDWWLRDLVASGQRVEEVIALKSSQSGFTQAAINIFDFLTRYLSGRGLYCIDSKEKAGKLCNFRIIPLLRKAFAEGLTHDQPELGTYLLTLANWVWEMVGSYSAGVFSEKSLNVAFADDIEYMVTEGGRTGFLDGVYILDHIRSRFTTADWHFLMAFSKPLDEGSQFITEHRGGSQHEWHWTCPHCARPFVPELKHLHYDKPACRDEYGQFDLAAVEQLTTCRCPLCHQDIDEKTHKSPMNAAGFYLPKAKAQRVEDRDPLLVPRRLSLRVNDMASPFPEVTWGRLAKIHILAQNNPEKMKHFVTNHGARPWKQKAIQLKDGQIKALIAGGAKAGQRDERGYLHGETQGIPRYRRGELPFVPIAITATADRQGDMKKFTICAWRFATPPRRPPKGHPIQLPPFHCAVLEYGAVLADQDLLNLNDPATLLDHNGDPFRYHPDVIRSCERKLAEGGSAGQDPVSLLPPIRAGFGLPAGCLIDSGFEGFDVYDFCEASGWGWYPSKGVPGLDAGGQMVEAKTLFKDGREIILYKYHDYAIKVHFYKDWIARHTHPKIEARKVSPLFLPYDIGDDFILELLTESLQPRKLNTKQFEWVHDKNMGPNDYGDAMKMQPVIWQIVGPFLAADHLARAEAAEAPK